MGCASPDRRDCVTTRLPRWSTAIAAVLAARHLCRAVSSILSPGTSPAAIGGCHLEAAVSPREVRPRVAAPTYALRMTARVLHSSRYEVLAPARVAAGRCAAMLRQRLAASTRRRSP
jgi:hypothetical protein